MPVMTDGCGVGGAAMIPGLNERGAGHRPGLPGSRDSGPGSVPSGPRGHVNG